MVSPGVRQAAPEVPGTAVPWLEEASAAREEGCARAVRDGRAGLAVQGERTGFVVQGRVVRDEHVVQVGRIEPVSATAQRSRVRW